MTPLPNWQRLKTGSDPIYILSEAPDWFVPTSRADRLIQRFLDGKPPANLDEQLLYNQLVRPEVKPYHGRHHYLELGDLKEIWFHLTNRCNLSCSHCLFESGPGNREELERDQLDRLIGEARQLGCRLYCFTGGEPFLYPNFPAVIQHILTDPGSHVVVLTNGLLLPSVLSTLSTLDPRRLHFQISLDGTEPHHDRLRGRGMYARTVQAIEHTVQAGYGVTLSMALQRENLDDMDDYIRLAGRLGVRNIHFLYHFIRGKGTTNHYAMPLEILPRLLRARETADAIGITIDTLETLKAQVFSTPGTRFDLSNSAWESLAIGPDGHVYPSPALVGVQALDGGAANDGLETILHDSPVLKRFRRATLDTSDYESNPLKFLIGGGDPDHSYLTGGKFSGHDPYVELYNGLALALIGEQARHYPDHGFHIRLKMGDVRFDCPDGNEVCLTHCNCAVSLAGSTGHASVREFYAEAAVIANTDIVNPFGEGQQETDYIPEDSRQRSYGCGSPVNDSLLVPGETVVDLGSGSGVECFLAAEMVGADGRVYGIDMTDEMLQLAKESATRVESSLGYRNVAFKKGFLEAIPLPDRTAQAVISNCVINLSPDKRRVFLEVFRILEPGGRLVVSDIVTDEPIPVAIKNDETFRGECLGGAMLQEDLLAMLRSTGFTHIELIKRFPYRQVGETRFFSLTFRAWKPGAEEQVQVIYGGPFDAIQVDGQTLFPGRKTTLTTRAARALGDSLFILDAAGGVTNLSMVSDCCSVQPAETIGQCGCQPEISSDPNPSSPISRQGKRRERDCMVCGHELIYTTKSRLASCTFCAREQTTNIICPEGHFICDACHQEEGLLAIRRICLTTDKTDLIGLLQEIRADHSIPMHGPEHHAMLPGIILAAARNTGLPVSSNHILTGINRGAQVPGGSCGFMGNCGAAIGVGIGFAVLLESTPLTPGARQKAQGATAAVLTRIAEMKAGRCCQRETWLALRETARLSAHILPTPLQADEPLSCSQYSLNRECVRKQCPLWETRQREDGLTVLPMN